MSATDLSLVSVATAPSPATSGTTLKVLLSEINSGGGGSDPIVPTTYPFYATVAPASNRPTRANSEIIQVTGASDDATHRTFTIVRSQGVPTTTARSIIAGDEMIVGLSAQDWIDGLGSVSFVYNEVPSGTVNGSNTAFDTAGAYVAGSIQVYRDGQLMKGGGADYTETDSNTITFVTAPVTGSVLLVSYQSAVSTAGNSDTLDGQHGSYFAIATEAANGWIASGETWVYGSADDPTFTFTVSADVTTKYSPGMRIKLTQTTAKYFIITAVSAYSGGNTTITLYGGTDYDLANAAITLPFYSTQKAPQGFPLSPTKWTAEFVDASNRTQATPTASTWYNIGTSTLSIPIGAWRVYYELVAEVDDASVTGVDILTTLSTANNSQTDTAWGARLNFNGASANTNIFMNVFKENFLVLASKTSYYLNCMTQYSGITSINFKGAEGKTTIRAVSAYL